MNTIMEEILLLTEEGNTKKHRKAARAEIYGAIQKANSKLTEILNVYAKEFEGKVTKKPDGYIVKTPYMSFYRNYGLLGYKENEKYEEKGIIKGDVKELLELMRKKNEKRYYALKVYRLGSEWEKYYDEACYVIDTDQEDDEERFSDKDFDKKNLPGSGNGLLSQAISDRVRSGYINKNIKQGEGDITFTASGGYQSVPGGIYNEKPYIGSKLERNIEQRIKTFSKNASVESLKYFKKKFPGRDFNGIEFKFNADFIFEKFYGGSKQLYIEDKKNNYRFDLDKFLEYKCGIDKTYQEEQAFAQYIKDKFKYEIDKIEALNNKKHTIKESCFNY